MPNFIKLSGVDFSNNSLPKLESFSDSIKALPGLLSWVSAADFYTLADESGLVSRLVDRTGNGNDFYQSADARKPTLVKNEMNGNSVVRFDSANKEYLQFSGSFPALATESYVKLLVVKVPAPASTSNILSSNTPSGSRHSLYCSQNSTHVAIEAADGPLKQYDFVDGWHLLIAEFDATTNQHKLTMDGLGTLTDDVAAAARNATLFLGAADTNGNGAASMDVAEIMILNQPITSNAENLAMIRRYVDGKYGIS